MAHQTREQLDAIAAQHSTDIADQLPPEAAPETTLAYGATGPFVTRLVDLLALLGFTTNTVIKGGPPVLDVSVLADVDAARAHLDIHEAGTVNPEAPEVMRPDEIPVGVKGELVGRRTWDGLYEAAEKAVAEKAAVEAAAQG